MSSVKRFISTGHFTGHKPVDCTMYTETDVSGSTLSESEKSAEKWQLGTAIPVWGIGELMKFVIKTFLYSAKKIIAVVSQSKNNIYDRNSNKNKHIRKDTCTQFTSFAPNIYYFNTGECLVTETRCCSTNGYRGEQQRSALTADVINLRHLGHVSDKVSTRERLYSRQLCRDPCLEVRL